MYTSFLMEKNVEIFHPFATYINQLQLLMIDYKDVISEIIAGIFQASCD